MLIFQLRSSDIGHCVQILVQVSGYCSGCLDSGLGIQILDWTSQYFPRCQHISQGVHILAQVSACSPWFLNVFISDVQKLVKVSRFDFRHTDIGPGVWILAEVSACRTKCPDIGFCVQVLVEVSRHIAGVQLSTY